MAPQMSRAGGCWPAPPLTNSSPSDPLHGVASKPPSPCAPPSRTSPYKPRALQEGCLAPPRRLSRKTEQRPTDSRRQNPREHDKPHFGASKIPVMKEAGSSYTACCDEDGLHGIMG